MYEIAIIGAGPAGASAALFTAKADKQTLVVDDADGLTQYAWVKNHYGVAEIDGPDMIDVGREQAEKFGAVFVQATVTDIEPQDGGFKLITNQGEFMAKQVLLATGAAVGLVEQIGLDTKPATEPEVEKILDVDAAGRTSKAGIWAAGIIAGVSPHTIITAGDGAKVAINILSEINGKRYVDHDAFSG